PIVAGGTTTFRIHEGHRFRLGKIEASGVAPDGLPMRAHVHAQTGDWFSRRAWVDDLAAVRALYQDVGYACVAITPETSIDRKHDVVDVTVATDLGPRVTIDRVDVI